MNIKKVLFPTDFSTPADKAFEYACFMAESNKADLELLHVVDQISGLTYYEGLAITPMEIAENMTKRAREGLQALVDRVEGSVNVVESVRQGSAWFQICEAAEKGNADMIVIGSHGRTGLSHALMGSVAERVARHASSPVLIVRETEN